VRSSATAIRVMDARDWIPLGVVLALLLLYLAWAFTDPTEEGQAAHPTSPGLASVVALNQPKRAFQSGVVEVWSPLSHACAPGLSPGAQLPPRLYAKDPSPAR
jgi:hypothetical protein